MQHRISSVAWNASHRHLSADAAPPEDPHRRYRLVHPYGARLDRLPIEPRYLDCDLNHSMPILLIECELGRGLQISDLLYSLVAHHVYSVLRFN